MLSPPPAPMDPGVPPAKPRRRSASLVAGLTATLAAAGSHCFRPSA